MGNPASPAGPLAPTTPAAAAHGGSQPEAATSSWRHVYRWDLDKTYLATDFDSVRGLLRTALEGAGEKVNVPGSAALLRELSAARPGALPSRVCVLSGSPTQMRRVLEEKLRLDGITWHEFHLKPQWENLRRGRFRALREQVGYKLPLLLRSRVGMPASARETLFGDDAEADAFVYSLYADAVSGRVPEKELLRVLKAAGAYSDAVDDCVASLRRIEPGDAVEGIFIRLERRSPPLFFRPFGARLVPVFNWFQAALVLFCRGHVDAGGVVAVTRAFLRADRRDAAELANLFQDLLRRGHLPGTAMQDLGIAVQELADVAGEAEVVWNCAQRFLDLGTCRQFRPPLGPEQADYVKLLEHLKTRKGEG
jgi:hypothetical protein